MVAYLRLLPVLGLLLADGARVAAQGSHGIANGKEDWTKGESSIIPGAYIVEFEDGHEEASLFSDLQRHGFSATKRLNLNYTLFKGASFQLDSVDLDPHSTSAKIASVPSVKQAWPVQRYKRPINTTLSSISSDSIHSRDVSTLLRRATSGNDTYAVHAQVQVDKLHAEGITGKGIRISIIDTGVDFNHPALGGCFGEGCVVSFGRDLVGDDYDGTNTPVPGPEPYSTCDGHGTHVTGIIGALPNPMGFIGAAPNATIGMYRVFGCSGDLGADVAIAAVNQAFEDGTDIITLSLGGSSGWTEDSFSVAVSRVVDAGVVCTVANGNSGSAGLFVAGTPANGKGVTAVSSVESTWTPFLGTGAFVSTDNSTTNQTLFVYTPGAYPFPSNITLQVWPVTPDVTTDGTYGACNLLSDKAPADLSDKVVLVKYDSACDSWTEVTNLQKNNATYYMFWYDSPGNPWSIGATSASGLGMTGYSQGVEWLNELSSGKDLWLTFPESSSSTKAGVFVPNAINPNYIDTFTSWGPTWQADVNPSISTPGGTILSTWPLPSGGYQIDTGTSMATPLMAAIYALLMQARGIKDPKTLLNLVSSTALQLPFYDGTNLYANELAPVAQQGAGLAQAYNAAHTTTLLNVPNIAFNDTDNFVKETSFTIKNTGKQSVTYTIGQTPALTMYTYGNGDSHFPAPFPNPIAEGASAKLSFSQSTITVPAGKSADITVTATPPQGLNSSAIPVYSGYVTVNGTNGDGLVVPYLGVVGSLANLPVLDPDFNYMIHYNVYSTVPAAANTTYIVPYPNSTVALQIDPEPDYPAPIIQIDAGTPLLRADLVAVGDTADKVNTTKVLDVDIVGSLAGYPLPYTSRSYFVNAFTGMTQEGTVVPEGSYQFLIRALKIYGDVNNPEDYESMLTQTFNIQYNTTVSA
ncbi:subtilisin-like protein [Trichoderma citrinoviride]|uniref:Subtilisin-like protein n=1 Tax=Trichoderma citrinoviride TaxID=58853 RepID=A0A2T4BLQ5_9HYPO|nr:subtilisin-like protein [Trichoderma citrinoviride]PTB70252.1 subtilisin-like protein [Trichoderma citrinoviride]